MATRLMLMAALRAQLAGRPVRKASRRMRFMFVPPPLNWLIVSTSDTYRAGRFRPSSSFELLYHPYQERVVGIRAWLPENHPRRLRFMRRRKQTRWHS